MCSSTSVSEHNYERPHIDDGILDFEGRHPTKQIVTKHSNQNITTTLQGTNTSKMEEEHNDDDDDDDDIEIPEEAIEAPNDTDYQELRPQHLNFTINHLPRSRITKASQSYTLGILQFLHIG
jgi:hypothetical protein